MTSVVCILRPAPHGISAKNSTWKVVFGVLLRLPVTVAPPTLSMTADAITGKFWRLFAPESRSPASFAVGPLLPRSIPSCRFCTKLFPTSRLPVPEAMAMPSCPLNQIWFPSMVLPVAPLVIRTPFAVLPPSCPIVLFWIVLPVALVSDMETPFPVLPLMKLRAVEATPPMTLFEPLRMLTPSWPFATPAALPDAFKPIRLPST